jgi:hypothetical protein
MNIKKLPFGHMIYRSATVLIEMEYKYILNILNIVCICDFIPPKKKMNLKKLTFRHMIYRSATILIDLE